MPRLNPISPRKLIKILLGFGFAKIRIHGSHQFFEHKDGRTTVVPVHGNNDICVGLLKKILRDTKISVKEFDERR